MENVKASKPNYHATKNFPEKLLAKEMRKIEVRSVNSGHK